MLHNDVEICTHRMLILYFDKIIPRFILILLTGAIIPAR